MSRLMQFNLECIHQVRLQEFQIILTHFTHSHIQISVQAEHTLVYHMKLYIFVKIAEKHLKNQIKSGVKYINLQIRCTFLMGRLKALFALVIIFMHRGKKQTMKFEMPELYKVCIAKDPRSGLKLMATV